MLLEVVDFINETCKQFNIDNSHGLGHAIKTLLWSLKIGKDINLHYRESLIIQLSCLLHDMCDKKYMDENYGVFRIRMFLTEKLKLEPAVIERVIFIITTMSYSKVIKNGYPDFRGDKIVETCYHIVRNSDLLESYDPERCIGYHVRCGGTRKEGIIRMFEIFEDRVLRLIDKGYINLEPAKQYATELHIKALYGLAKYREELDHNISGTCV
jgi:hypothetical protein